MRARPHVAALLIALAALFDVACGQATLSTTAPDAPKCQVSVDPPPSSAPSGGGTGTIAVATTRDCTWAAASDAAWLTITSDHSGQGSGTVAYRVDANPQPAARSGTIHVNSVQVAVAQEAAPCKFAVSPPNAAVSASGGSVAITVQTLTGCKWTADADAPWLHVMSGASGDGAGTVHINADANSAALRIGHVRIGDQSVTIDQADAPTPPPPPPPTPTPPPPTPTPTPPPPTPCHYSLATNSQTMPAGGGSNTVSVQADGGCAWTATSNASWITITGGASGSGNGAVVYTAAANGGAARTATLTIAGATLTVSQPAVPPPACTYAISPASQSIDSAGGNGSAAVTANSGCTWTAVSNAAWITISSGASGSGNGTVAFNAAANNGAARSGTLTIAGQTFSVAQAAAPAPPPCTYAISPTSQAVDASGGNGSVGVTANSGCAWAATSSVPWITISSGASGSGNGTVAFAVAANTGAARSGTLTIAGQSFSVSQAAAPPPPPPPCTFAISPTSQSVDASGGSGSVGVTANSGCAWMATSNAAWITISSGASGSGNGTVAFTAAANTGAARTGTLTIAGQAFSVSQAASPPPPPPPCTYSISPTSASVAASGGSAASTIATGSTCTWSATSNADWLSIASGASGTGNGSVTISVAPNATGAARSGTATIAGQTFTVTQSGS